MHEEAARLQNEASVLAERLQAVLHDKFRPQHHTFDAETPIDKALNFLSRVISVWATVHPNAQYTDVQRLTGVHVCWTVSEQNLRTKTGR